MSKRNIARLMEKLGSEKKAEGLSLDGAAPDVKDLFAGSGSRIFRENPTGVPDDMGIWGDDSILSTILDAGPNALKAGKSALDNIWNDDSVMSNLVDKGKSIAGSKPAKALAVISALGLTGYGAKKVYDALTDEDKEQSYA